MDYEQIKNLLNKYWACETDAAEELQIRKYFSEQDDLPEDLEKERHLFGYYSNEAKSPVAGEDLTQKLKQTWLEEPSVIRIPVWKTILKYAAIIIPLVVAGYLFYQDTQKDAHAVYSKEDTFKDSEEAIAETEKALMLLSKNLNDGLEKAQSIKVFSEPAHRTKENNE
ncbi:MAG TPA: hypothetical protein VF622_15555 [Segetibacter sp.]|jgi:hypothetical protein